MGEAQDLAREGEQAARAVSNSGPYRLLVTVGLVSYGVVHLLIGWLAVRLALGVRGTDASQQGAIQQLAATPMGGTLLWVVAAGFATLVTWHLMAALIGHREFQDGKRTRKRLGSALRAVVHAGLAATAVTQALSGRGSGDGGTRSASAVLLKLPAGQVIALLIGLAVIGYGVRQVVKAATKRFNDDLVTPLSGVPARLTQAGFVGRGIAIAVIGVLFAWAALAADPRKATGFDGALRTILSQPYGPILLVVVAIGIACYGIYCFFWAGHAKFS